MGCLLRLDDLPEFGGDVLDAAVAAGDGVVDDDMALPEGIGFAPVHIVNCAEIREGPVLQEEAVAHLGQGLLDHYVAAEKIAAEDGGFQLPVGDLLPVRHGFIAGLPEIRHDGGGLAL